MRIAIVLGNYGTHKHPNVAAWLDKHPRFHLHFTPTSSSWPNLVWVCRPSGSVSAWRPEHPPRASGGVG
ncbi:MAG: hypothetical protein ACYDEN_15085 [Acidimicrobiales bacterium]